MAGQGQRMLPAFASTVLLVLQFMTLAAGEDCGNQAGGIQCPGAQCCSIYGWCGTSSDYCGNGCQSNCGGQGSGSNGGPSSSQGSVGNASRSSPEGSGSNGGPSSSQGSVGNASRGSPEGSGSNAGVGSTGIASFYETYVPSACYASDPGQFPGDMHFAAGGDSDSANIWNDGHNCGKTFRIQCQGNGCRGSGAITVKVVDRCPDGCSGGRAFDLSSQAFADIADPDAGIITVTYSPA